MSKPRELLTQARRNWREWFTVKWFILISILLLATTAFHYWKYRQIDAALYNFIFMGSVIFLSAITRDRSTSFLGGILLVVVGVFLLNSVFNDLIITIKITVGFFLMKVGFDSAMTAIGVPYQKLAFKLFSKRAKGNEREINKDAQ